MQSLAVPIEVSQPSFFFLGAEEEGEEEEQTETNSGTFHLCEKLAFRTMYTT